MRNVLFRVGAAVLLGCLFVTLCVGDDYANAAESSVRRAAHHTVWAKFHAAQAAIYAAREDGFFWEMRHSETARTEEALAVNCAALAKENRAKAQRLGLAALLCLVGGSTCWFLANTTPHSNKTAPQ